MTKWAKDIIEAEGLGTTYDPSTAPNGDIFISQNPDKNDVIILYDEVGVPDAVDNAYARDGYGLMVMTRGSYSYAKEKIWDIHRALVGRTLESHTDGTLVQCMIQSPPQYVENSDKGRRVYTAHYIAPVEQSDAGQRIAIT
jgi:hypothetical protein